MSRTCTWRNNVQSFFHVNDQWLGTVLWATKKFNIILIIIVPNNIQRHTTKKAYDNKNTWLRHCLTDHTGRCRGGTVELNRRQDRRTMTIH